MTSTGPVYLALDLHGSTVAQQLFNVLTPTCLYGLIAVSITLVFGLTRFVNFAQGDLVAVAGYLVLVVAKAGGVEFVLGLLLACVAVGALSAALYFGLFRFTTEQPINGFLVSLGLVLLIENGLAQIAGPNEKSVSPAFAQVLTSGGVRLPVQQILVIVATIALLGALVTFLARSRRGIELRACAADRNVAAMIGVPVTSLVALVFVVAGALSGAAGAFLATLNPITPQVGYQYVLIAFVVALAGGLGNVPGAILCSVLVAAIDAVVTVLGYGQWEQVAVYGVLLVVLLIRPTGLLRGVPA